MNGDAKGFPQARAMSNLNRVMARVRGSAKKAPDRAAFCFW
jgi:hypothetical protein